MKIWEIKYVGPLGLAYENARLDQLLREGWEPYAATEGTGLTIHLRRITVVDD